MISLQGPQGAVEHSGAANGGGVPSHAIWIDLNDPSAEEAEHIEAATGLRVPSLKALSEV